MSISDPAAAHDLYTRRRLRVTGVVQGVGFRPFVYGLAHDLALGGFVGNDSAGVFIEIEGSPSALDTFAQRLREDAPPLARIEAVTAHDIAPQAETRFVIVESATEPGAQTLISPDLCVCDDCLREISDPADRRYRYPFTNCTNCGPRFTIIRDIPYDRPKTTMDAFPMCAACAAEYHDPHNRRFHAQPNACPDCGPQISYIQGETRLDREDALQAARAALKRGEIVAVKGLGGFHLACDASNADAVNRLRERKRRPHKPLAVMVADMDTARTLAQINADEAHLLESRERPIVLVKRLPNAPLAAGIAPGNDQVGLMLPYTPLHFLLLADLPPLVMTSGNISGEPIITDNADAQSKLGAVADAFLLHDRAIYIPCDDSVVRVVPGADGGAEIPVRRSRGYAPLPVKLPFAVPDLLACGGELKNTFCLTHNDHAFMSGHIGDMQNLETLTAFDHALDHMRALFRVEPTAVVCDLHPGYLSSRAARAYADRHGLPLVEIQHHHAHIAGVMAEHGLDPSQRVTGISFDGTGYGTDGTIWGGEVLLADYAGFTRYAHLKTVPLPGGDAAVKNPYRVALAHLWAAGIAWDNDLAPVKHASEEEGRILRRQLERSLNTAQTSSMGRLFDAVAALVGLRQTVTFEAQAAIELESIARKVSQSPYTFALVGSDRHLHIDPAPVLKAIVADLRAGVSAGIIAGWFHAAVTDMVVRIARRVRDTHGLDTVALSGGVFQNARLLASAQQRLQAEGFAVLTNHRVPANDGGLALGQAVVAGHMADAL